MSGFGAPSLTITPTPTRAMFTRLPSAILPFLIRPSTAPGDRNVTSNASPPSIFFTRAPTVSFSIATLCPVCFSNSGASATTICLKAPAVSTLMSAATARLPVKAMAARSKAAAIRGLSVIFCLCCEITPDHRRLPQHDPREITDNARTTGNPDRASAPLLLCKTRMGAAHHYSLLSSSSDLSSGMKHRTGGLIPQCKKGSDPCCPTSSDSSLLAPL